MAQLGQLRASATRLRIQCFVSSICSPFLTYCGRRFGRKKGGFFVACNLGFKTRAGTALAIVKFLRQLTLFCLLKVALAGRQPSLITENSLGADTAVLGKLLDWNTEEIRHRHPGPLVEFSGLASIAPLSRHRSSTGR